jgi:hypothetical protein
MINYSSLSQCDWTENSKNLYFFCEIHASYFSVMDCHADMHNFDIDDASFHHVDIAMRNHVGVIGNMHNCEEDRLVLLHF